METNVEKELDELVERMQTPQARRAVDALFSSFTVKEGSYHVESGCQRCGVTPVGIRCYPGEWAQCQNCGFKLLYLGRVPDAECVTPNGRIDGHNTYQSIVDGTDPPEWVCSFCRKK